MKYRGRKEYTLKEAGENLESIMQQWSTNQECINYWKRMPRTRSDILIEALTNKTRQQAIEETEKQQEYLESKREYMKKFNPGYTIKGSFGIAY